MSPCGPFASAPAVSSQAASSHPNMPRGDGENGSPKLSLARQRKEGESGQGRKGYSSLVAVVWSKLIRVGAATITWSGTPPSLRDASLHVGVPVSSIYILPFSFLMFEMSKGNIMRPALPMLNWIHRWTQNINRGDFECECVLFQFGWIIRSVLQPPAHFIDQHILYSLVVNL